MRLLALAVLGSGLLNAADPVLALNGLDPVALIAGQELPGRENLTQSRKGYLYRFATEENLKKFEADPARNEIQMDGACARMGPASGAGDPARWMVYSGRIYVFASDACRKSFAADPANHIEKPEAPPVLIPVAVTRGKALWAKAILAAGGEKALKSITSWEEESASDKITHVTRLRVNRDGTEDLRIETHYPNYGAYTRVITSSVAANVDPKATLPMRGVEREAVLRDANRRPLMALLARNRDDFKVWWESTGKVGAEPVEIVGVFFDNVVTRYGIDAKTGRIVAAWWRGRATPALAEIEARFGDFRAVGPLSLPFTVEMWLGGKARGTRTVTSQKVNGQIDPALFAVKLPEPQ